ncbi:MAG TPA: ABC transporter substrate-binding protein [Acetobacteraceae bacterium]|nr:ABC transporter substrate-binding protein [Acetobacteraceae bacterium]
MRHPRSSIAELIVLLLLAAPGLATARAASAKIPSEKITIGVLDSGGGDSSERRARSVLVAAEVAAEEFETHSGRTDTEMLYSPDGADPARAPALAASWLDHDDAAAIVDSFGGAGDDAIARDAAARHRAMLVSSLLGDAPPALCGSDVLRWGPDLGAYTAALVAALAPQRGRRWFVIAAADAVGAAVQRDIATGARSKNLSLVGTATTAPGQRDYTPALLQAAKAGAQVIVLALGGRDLADAVRDAAALGLTTRATVAAPLARLDDIAAIGLADAENIVVPASFFWDENEATRAFARHFAGRTGDRLPDANQAAVYQLVAAYLRAAKAARSIDAAAVLGRLKSAPIPGAWSGSVAARPDGTVPQPIGIYRVKRPEQSRGPGDDYARIAMIPVATAYARPECGGP